MKSDLSLLASFLHRELHYFAIAKMLSDPTSQRSVSFGETAQDTSWTAGPDRPGRSENAEPALGSASVPAWWQQDAQTRSEWTARAPRLQPAPALLTYKETV